MSLPRWTLKSLLLPWLPIESEQDTHVLQLCEDSRLCGAGDLFVVLLDPKVQADRVNAYIEQAVAKGAAAVLMSQPVADMPAMMLPVIIWPELLDHWPELVDRYYHSPSEHIKIVAITGTNGKTTCAWWVAQVLVKLGHTCGIAGTLGVGSWSEGVESWPDLVPSVNTTPSHLQLQQALTEWHRQGISYAVLEASSHGLAQNRLVGIQLDVAVLTNLSRDHMDYHQNMEAYAASKAKLFDWPSLTTRWLNRDEEFGLQLCKHLANENFATYSVEKVVSDQHDVIQQVEDGRAGVANMHIDIRILAEQSAATDVHVGIVIDDQANPHCPVNQKCPANQSYQARWPFVGYHNVQNAAAVLGAVISLGFEPSAVVKALESVALPPGRLQSVANRLEAKIWVDYAHTPDALQAVLSACRQLCTERLIVVFGCGGNRDQGKRAVMGQVAAQLADVIIVTSDNPRDESPQVIIEQVVAGIVQQQPAYSGELICIVDRRLAIEAAVELLQPGDGLLVAGKGHESEQIIKGQVMTFDDVAVIQTCLAQ